MGKIIETNYHETVGKITSFSSELINNTFYTLNDKKPTIVTYYNINKADSTLDPGSKLAYDNIGGNSPIRYNKINDFIIYGFNKVELQTENDEFGLEAEKISGDCYILPNTIKPIEGDYFEVEHIKDSTWLFIVTDVQQDTLMNGSNVYKITYKLEYVDNERLQNQVIGDFKLIEKREGTNVIKVVETTKFEKAKVLDEKAVMLKYYYNELFYNKKVQTFIYRDLTEWQTYDPFMIEFLIRNKILDNGLDSYIHVCHQIDVNKTFTIDYDKTFYRAFEKKSISDLMKSLYNIIPEEIKAYGTTFAGRYETYFKTNYINTQKPGYTLATIPAELIYDVEENKIIDENIEDLNVSIPLWKNIIVKYFNGGDITEKELESINEIKFEYAPEAFYFVPLLIFCIEYSIENLLN